MSPTPRLGFMRQPRRLGKAEEGVVLIVALIVLVVMTLAGLAMMRQAGSGMSIAGNLAFKENATSAADSGTEAGRTFLINPTNTQALLSSDDHAVGSGNGYYASWGSTDAVDPSAFPWDNAVQLPTDSTGNTVSYLIHRLCQQQNLLPDAPGQRCSDAPSKDPGSGKGPFSYGSSGPPPPPPTPFFRITTKVDGPRKTVSYVQVLVSN